MTIISPMDPLVFPLKFQQLLLHPFDLSKLNNAQCHLAMRGAKKDEPTVRNHCIYSVIVGSVLQQFSERISTIYTLTLAVQGNPDAADNPASARDRLSNLSDDLLMKAAVPLGFSVKDGGAGVEPDPDKVTMRQALDKDIEWSRSTLLPASAQTPLRDLGDFYLLVVWTMAKEHGLLHQMAVDTVPTEADEVAAPWSADPDLNTRRTNDDLVATIMALTLWDAMIHNIEVFYLRLRRFAELNLNAAQEFHSQMVQRITTVFATPAMRNDCVALIKNGVDPYLQHHII